jgi:predicted RNA-binding Zn-ribbon protein involved in translation (DUF1610 family)/cation transport regulator ChaB
VEEEEPVKNSKPCPECGVERHKKKPITCAFKLWTEDFPNVPRMDKESTRDAHQRIWPAVRQYFYENGVYAKKDGYSFAGPAGTDYVPLGTMDVDVQGVPPPPATPASPQRPKAKRRPSQPRASTGGMSTTTVTSDAEDGKPGKTCPECGLERHKKKPITCAFKLWTTDYPMVPKNPGERTRDAHHRIWEAVRHHFMEGDQYVKKEGWTHMGPDAGDIPEPGPKPKPVKRVKEAGESAGSPPKRSKTEEEKVSKHCPECGAERHRKKPSSCPFKQWTDDFPNVPRLGREHIRDAQRRIWGMVRKQFVDGEHYVKREGWTYVGPTSS